MPKRLSLASLSWTLHGYMPRAWKLSEAAEIGVSSNHEVGPLPITLPGSVQKCLRDHGVIPDWNVGLNARLVEWVENRDWVLSAKLPADCGTEGEPVWFVCEGLDSHGVILVNGRAAGEFRNAFVPHRFELTHLLKGGGDLLQIVFTEIPRALGQVAYTSQIREWKPRFNYGWDWTSRLVQIGVWDDFHLEIGEPGLDFSSIKLLTSADAQQQLGKIMVRGISPAAAKKIRLHLRQDEERAVNVEITPDILLRGFDWNIPGVRLWWPNLHGSQPLYDFVMEALDGEGRVLARDEERVGFKQIEWLPCAGAPPETDPWICRVNGKAIFLQGVNWTPIRPNFADVTSADVRARLQTYAGLGCNLLRVWGGAVLERENFYRYCDELGLLVWQEFPLSSSALDNWPPEDEVVMLDLEHIATSYVRRRRHHASLLMWCGGNELQGALDGNPVGIGKPVTEAHPLIRRFRDLVAREDEGHRFLPTSACGPRFTARPEDFGKNLHWDVHGPWRHWDVYGPSGTRGPFEKQWSAYWDKDDALFRSETGFPGASPAALIHAFSGKCGVLPASAENPLWQRTSWWLQGDDFRAEHAREPHDLEEFVEWSQQLQARALEIAARACRDRFPRMGGILIWMGHDSFPCTANTAILDFEGKPKPAALALAQIFCDPPTLRA
jgi:beta-mannosidase